MSEWQDLIYESVARSEVGDESKIRALVELLKRAEQSLQTLANIVIREFSYDGENPDGVKRYQPEVNKAREVIADLEQYKGNESEAQK